MTDEQAGFTPATVRRRLASMLYEAFLLAGVLAVAFVLPQLLLGMARQTAAHGLMLWLHVFAVLLVYFLWFWRHGGQTLAMKTWKIRLVSSDGAPPASRQLLLRYVLAWPSLLLCGLGVIWALFDRDRQFLHDRLAGTRLIRA